MQANPLYLLFPFLRQTREHPAIDAGDQMAYFVNGGMLTFTYRPYALDFLVDFEKSSTLLPGSWLPMIEGLDYTVDSTLTGQPLPSPAAGAPSAGPEKAIS